MINNKHQDNVVYIHNARPLTAEEHSKTTPAQRLQDPLSDTVNIGDYLRAQFEDGDLGVVAWKDARNLLACPWGQVHYPYELQSGSALSAGFMFNYPDLEKIVVFPHLLNVPIETGPTDLGQIHIPYGSVHSVTRLASTSKLGNDEQKEVEQDPSKAILDQPPTETRSEALRSPSSKTPQSATWETLKEALSVVP
jgi:hypothetical protein